MKSLKPERMPFLWPRILSSLIACGMACVGMAIGSVFAGPWLLAGIPLVFVLLLPAFYGAHVAYTKEAYTLESDHLIRDYGGLFSDGRNELDIRNITHVRLRLPWPRHRLFGVGDVRVESAGSAQAEVTFQAVKDPEVLYARIQELMRENGYAMGRSEVLHQESPSPLGALADIGQIAVGLVFAAFWGGAILSGILAEFAPRFAAVLIPLEGVGAVVLALGGIAIRYLDFTRRTYTVYDDVVEYTEGFLTCDNAFIPYENIADAAVNRTVFDQVLGLYDVGVSCQGSGSEVKFRKLSNGPAMQEAISSLVANARLVEKPKPVRKSAAAGDGGERPPIPKHAREVVPAEDAWTADLKMNLGSALAMTLPAILLGPLWLLIAVGVGIRASMTKYRVGVDAISSDFSFIGSQVQQFAFDKVTGVRVERTPVHDFFGTVSIQIWSIGAPQALTLRHVNAAEVDLPALLRQSGIVESPVEAEFSQSFGFKVWLIQNASFLVILAVVSLVCLALTPVFPVALVIPVLVALLPIPSGILTYLRVQRQRVTVHTSHIESQTGVVLRQHTYARYDSIKKVETIAVPFTEQGRFRVYVAGEMVIQQGQNGTRIVPYVIEGAYIEDIHHRVDAMDALLLGRIEPAAVTGTHPQDDDLLRTSKPAIANTAAVLGVISLIIWPLVLVLAVRIWQLKVAQYDIESDRVVYRHGILFKTVTSVLFDRIDSLQQNQGALGKAFSNGSVTVLTAGSSSPDLILANLPDYGEVYATVREGYGR